MPFNHIIIFEPEIAGHQSPYLRLITEYLLINHTDFRVTFVLHPYIQELWEASHIHRIQEKGHQLTYLSLQNARNCSHKAVWKRSLHRWRLMCSHLKETGAEHGHFLFFDHIQLPLALRLPIPKGKTFSGIMFRPSFHDTYQNDNSSSHREKIRDFRKKWLFKSAIGHSALLKVLTLDPTFPEYAKSRFPGRDKMEHLPDPALFDHWQTENGKNELHGLLNKFDEKVTYLFFGALQERKGVLQVLQALHLLTPEIVQKIRIIFAGKIDQDLRSAFFASYNELLIEYRNRFDITVLDRYLSDKELRFLLEKCDVVLAPYQRFIGSSGVLLWAAGALKPVITQEYGLLGYLTRAYNLGLAINTTEPAQIARAITRFASESEIKMWDRSGMRDLANRNSPENFLNRFFTTLNSL